jgi:hypothetical protein
MDPNFDGVVTFDEFMEHGGILLDAPMKSSPNPKPRTQTLHAAMRAGWGGVGGGGGERDRASLSPPKGERDAVEEAMSLIRSFEEKVMN